MVDPDPSETNPPAHSLVLLPSPMPVFHFADVRDMLVTVFSSDFEVVDAYREFLWDSAKVVFPVSGT